jgi:hypothetical protein
MPFSCMLLRYWISSNIHRAVRILASLSNRMRYSNYCCCCTVLTRYLARRLAQLQPVFCQARGQVLRISVAHKELYAVQVSGNHVVHCIAASASYAYHNYARSKLLVVALAQLVEVSWLVQLLLLSWWQRRRQRCCCSSCCFCCTLATLRLY